MDAIILQGAFYLLFLVALVGFITQRNRIAFDILLMFSSLAGLYAFQFLGVLFPSARELLNLVSSMLLVAQPAFAIRLTQHITAAVPRWSFPAMVVAYVAMVASVLTLGQQFPWLIWLVGAYFVVGDGVAAFVLAREGRRRAGLARWRLLAAAGAMALLAVAIVALLVGGPVGTELSRWVGILAAVAFVLSFIPPRWLRRVVQQAVAFGYFNDLARTQPGAGTAGLWQELANLAIGLTGALGAEVRINGSSQPIATAGVENGLAPYLTDVPFSMADMSGSLRLRTPGPALFEEDDLALLAMLGSQTLGASEREKIIEERTAIGERLAATNVELARASAAKSDFLAAMSHELRTPLNAIIGFSELLETPPIPLTDESIGEYAGHIHRAGEHLLDLINDILDLSRVEAGRLELRYEDVDAATLVREVMATVTPLAEVKRLSLTTSLPASLFLEADAGRLRQIVYNLLSNAIKFTPSEGSVSVSVTPDGEGIVLTVADTGPGIPEADQERIFAAFEQLTPGSAEGTGLGLALTRRLVQAHGGRIELASEAGTGSTFSVHLPMQRPVIRDAGSVEADDGKGPLVLIIEDDAVAAELLRVQLRQAGYRAAVAVDGESGLKAAVTLAPEAILLDIVLPGVDGWDVLRALRGDPATRSIPVMVVTVVDDAALGMTLGAQDYFVKPVARETLLTALARSLNGGDRPKTVLAIDDDPAALVLYRNALSGRDGITVVTARTGLEGVERAMAGGIDSIILDLVLPDLSGFEVAAQLRADALTCDIPIVVVTGQTLDDATKERLNRHALRVLAKGDAAISGLREWLGSVTQPVTS